MRGIQYLRYKYACKTLRVLMITFFQVMRAHSLDHKWVLFFCKGGGVT